MHERVYLDHAATSPMPPLVLEALLEAFAVTGNPASTHGHGQAASELLEGARERIAAHLGADAAEVILTGGGTESINLALKGMWWARQRAASRPVMLIAEGEHHATIEAAEWLRDSQGAQLHWLPIDAAGMLHPETLIRAIELHGARNIALISVLWANNEVGTIQPIAALGEIANEAGIPLHVDAVAALGQLPIDFRESGAAALSLSAHKIGGPAGVGALLLARAAQAESLLHGGSQQRSRAGSQNAAGAVGFAAALDLAYGDDFPQRCERVTALRDRLILGVRALLPGAVLRGYAAPEPRDAPILRLPGNAHFTFPGCQGDSLVYLLDASGISASVGSACQVGVAEISHVLLAMGVDESEAAGALRFTLGFDTTEGEIDRLLAVLPGAVSRARAAGLA